jgi:hypothetical protein
VEVEALGNAFFVMGYNEVGDGLRGDRPSFGVTLLLALRLFLGFLSLFFLAGTFFLALIERRT